MFYTFSLAFLLISTVSGSLIVETDCGSVSGSTNANNGIISYLGIPYATPPLGSLRWQPSISLKEGNRCWNGVLNATSFGNQCVQNLNGVVGDEDCLYLNVWTPSASKNQDTLLPVMVYIHGGSFVIGNGNIDGERFMAVNNGSVILVTINYRLNIFGFLALKQLSDADPRGSSGNYGLFDAITALKWVQTNIKAFGGDPNSVTIFGQSSGGTAVLMLLISHYSKGLFHKAISESASTCVDKSLYDAELQNIAFLNSTKCGYLQQHAPEKVLSCLYSSSAVDLINSVPWHEYPYYDQLFIQTDLPNPIYGFGAHLGIVDGDFVQSPIEEALDDPSQFMDVPLIIGTNQQEIDFHPEFVISNYTIPEYEDYIIQRFSPWGSEFGKRVLHLYNITNYENAPQLGYDTIGSDIRVTCGQIYLAKKASRSFKSPVYHYIVSHRPGEPANAFGMGYYATYAFHGIEMMALLDIMDQLLPGYNTTTEDRIFGTVVRDFWIELAAKGMIDSNSWREMTMKDDYTHYYSLQLDTTTEPLTNWRREECEFWFTTGFYPYGWNS